MFKCFWTVFSLGAPVSLTERPQTVAVSLQKPTIIWLFQDLGKLPSQLAKHWLNHNAAVILACVASVSNRVYCAQVRAGAKRKKVSPPPPPSFPFCFALVPTFSTNSRESACYAGYQSQPAREESREKGNSVLFDSYPPFRSSGRKPCSAWLIRTELNTQNSDYKFY